ncbi:MAG: AraC family transcriptional regulator [Caulobacteraceae bacterium]|nr:AraC family transcriptional regulator [Caulobacteraceae bacterium]
MTIHSDQDLGLVDQSRREELIDLLKDAMELLEAESLARRHIARAYGLLAGAQAEAGPPRGNLAAWQARQVEAFIGDQLGSNLRIESAAAVARLSASYFSRAFKATFGLSFSEYVTQKRVERAQRLLASTRRPICEIALECGLADQSHLTRLFTRHVGLPPNAWRRRVAEADPRAEVRTWRPEANAA